MVDGFPLDGEYFFMFWEVAQLVMIRQYERWEWMRAKYRDLRADLV
jgi:hypothetical protein